ncbi:MAG: S8 family serine peptidase [Sarcina sp.]|nr:S8 family serine peptidase [Sarcina sp.]
MSKTNRNENNKKDDFSNQRAEKIASGIPARSAGLLLCLFISLAAAFSLTGPLRAQAGTGSSKTKVIKTTTDESFAIQSAKLAKKNPGLTVKTTGKARPYSSARLIVGLKSGKKVDFSKYKAATVVESSFGVSIVQFSSESAAKKAAASLKKLSSVRYVDADDCTLDLGDYEVKKIYYDESSYEKDMGTSSLSKEAVDADTYDKSELNNLDYIYDATLKKNVVTTSSTSMSWGVSALQADKYAAYVKSYTARSVKVAIVDSGVSYHKKMDGRILSGIDLVDDDYTPSDQNGHGTHVAGTVVDCTPGIKVYILPVRVMNASGEGSPSVVGNGIRYAVSKGAKVINLSLGGYSHYQYLEDCINYAHNSGVTVVIASGNENENTKNICPAHMTNPIVVGAINSDYKRCSFSNYGSSVDLAAPGDNIISCWVGGGYALASGTSMAAPHISGAAAMYRLMYPNYGSSKTAILLRSFVQDLGASGQDDYYGKGLPKMTGPIKPLRVTLNKSTAKVEIKKTLTLKATLTPSYAGQKALTWSSSNTAVATVSSSGKVTAKKKGTATITAEGVGGKKGSCKVTVIGVQPTGVTLNLSTKTLHVGSSYTLKATVSPSNAENKTLTWKTGSNSVATVHEGTVKARGEGTITITAITANGKKAACKVTVLPKATVTASAKSQPVVLADDEALSLMPAAAAQEIAAEENIDVLPAQSAAVQEEYAYAAPVQSAAAEEENIYAPPVQIAAAEEEMQEDIPAPSDQSPEEEENTFSEAEQTAEEEDASVESGLTAEEEENPIDPETGIIIDPEAEDSTAPETGKFIDSETGNNADPEAENPYDPAAEQQENRSLSLFLEKEVYTAGSGDRSVDLLADIRLPGQGDPALNGQTDQFPVDDGEIPDATAQNRDTYYILAMLREEQDGTKTLLGAVDLIPGPDEDSDEDKTYFSAGILSRTGAVKNEDTWALSLRADLSPWTEKAAPGEQELDQEQDQFETEQGWESPEEYSSESIEGYCPASYTDRMITWNCVLAVYDRHSFEEREYASSIPDPESCSLIDAEALCSCPFTLNIN